ncbi:MAG: replicative DNA helicase [Bacteroidales bacterium]|nr:replicative DNA helicase [Bacteroidales bacterium]
MTDKRKLEKTIAQLNEDYGKIPPQASDLEEAVLGAILIEVDAIHMVTDILSPESFYKSQHAVIFECMFKLNRDHQPIDLLTVTEELRKIGKLEEVGGPHFLSSLTARVGTAAHIEYHAKIIQQKFIQRELIKVGSEIQNKSYDQSVDVETLLNFAESEVFRVSEGQIKKEALSLSQLVHQVAERIEEASKREDRLLGVPSGFSELDRLTAGWQPSDLVIIAARPSMGKTAFVLSMARNMAVVHNQPVAVFSLEMNNLQLVSRLISIEAELPGDKLRVGNLQKHEWIQLEQKIKVLEDAPIYIDDTAAISIFELKAKCRRLVQHKNVKAIIIDYLQLMTAGTDMRGNREQEVSTISRSLKAIAKDLNVPIIALSQLNRSVEMRAGDKRPQLSDLRESGAIEQDADMVVFIHRPDYYQQTDTKEGDSLRGMAEIIVAKHRNGATSNIWLRFKNEYAKFMDPEITIGGVAPITNGNAFVVGSKMNSDNSSFPADETFFDDSTPQF